MSQTPLAYPRTPSTGLDGGRRPRRVLVAAGATRLAIYVGLVAVAVAVAADRADLIPLGAAAVVVGVLIAAAVGPLRPGADSLLVSTAGIAALAVWMGGGGPGRQHFGAAAVFAAVTCGSLLRSGLQQAGLIPHRCPATTSTTTAGATSASP